MKKLPLYLLATLAVLYCIGLSMKPDTNPSPSLEAQTRQGFMDGCIKESNGEDAYCNCTYDGLIDLYGFNGLLDNVGRLAREEFSEADMAVVNRCAVLI